MANVDKPNGLIPVKYLSGAPWNGQAQLYAIAAATSAVFRVGDPVCKHADGCLADGTPLVTLATPGSTQRILGVIVGFLPNKANRDLSVNYRTTGAKAYDDYVLVCDDPNVIYEIQDDGVVAATAAVCGLNANLINTHTGQTYGMELNSSTWAADVTMQMLILRPVKREDNAIGARCRWEVLLNLSQLRAGDSLGV